MAIAICILKGLEMNQLKQIIELDCPQWHVQRKRVFSTGGAAPTLNGIGRGGNTEPKVLIRRKENERDKSDSKSAN